jgi:ribosomal-protein-alanine N-acetyltransferase
MTEAVNLALRHAFKNLKLHRIEANVQPENFPSIAVLKRCGFSKEGFSRRYLKIKGKWRDHERWAIIKEDWKINFKK